MMGSPRHLTFAFTVVLCAVGTLAPPATAQDLPPGFILVGDMILDSARLTIHPAAPGSLATPAGMILGTTATYTPRYWPNGVVPVEFSADINADQRAMFSEACMKWSQAANVQCIAHTSEANFVRVVNQPTQACASYVGQQFDGAQELFLATPDCWHPHTVLHELGHLLGLLHEHQRPDRDSYLTINTANLHSSAVPSFAIIANGNIRTNYDFQSVMHYFNRYGAIDSNQFVMIVKPGYEQFQGTMGTPPGGRPTPNDAETVRQLYGAPVVPSPPGAPVLSGSIDGNRISLNWTPSDGSAPTSYTLHWGTGPGASNLGTTVLGPITATTVTITTDSVYPGSRVYMRIIASNQYGAASSNEINLVTDWLGKPLLTATQVSANPITLNWTAGSSGFAPQGYALYVGTTPGASDLGAFPMGLTTSVTASAPEGLRIYVRVVASLYLDSATSNEINFIIGGATAPGTPVLTSSDLTANPITLNWSAGPGGTPQRYTLQAGTGTGLSDVGSVDMGLATGISANAPLGMPLFLRVVAQNAAGSATSNEISFMLTPPPPPIAPVMQSPIVTGTTVQLSWTGAAGAAYTLRARATPNGPVLISAPVGSITSLTVPAVASGTYHVTALIIVGGQSSAESNQVVVTVP